MTARRTADGRRDAWLGVELRHLAALCAVAETGSFRGAAQRLGYVQSAISQHIAALESIVGARMVERERGSGPVRLTEMGQLMLGHADGVLAQMRAARADVASLVGQAGDVLRVGATHDVAARVLPLVLRSLAGPLAQGAIRLIERTDDGVLLSLLHDGDADLAFAELPLPPGPYGHVELAASSWLLFAGPSAGALNETMTLDDLATLPLIGARGSRAFSEVEGTLRQCADGPRIVFWSDVWQTVRALVDAALGSALIPRLFASNRDVGAAMDLGELVPPFRLAVAWHRERRQPELARPFVSVAQRELSAPE